MSSTNPPSQFLLSSLDKSLMEPVAVVVGQFKEFGRSTETFVKEMLQRWHKRATQRPIEILKRLQREAFSDLMKLRERQDKVERMLSFYQSGKVGPFQEARTHMKGIINADAALMFIENDYDQGSNNLDRIGTRRGIDLRFIFETSIRQRDLLIAEFLASHCSLVNHSNMHRSPLVLSKLLYLANICDSLSAVIVPSGAQCAEFGTTSFQQGGHESISSFFSPSLFHQSESCGLGFIVRGSNLAASLAGLVSGSGEEARSVGNIRQSFFGQISYKPSEEARLTMSGIWQTCRPSQLPRLGPMVLPWGSLSKRTAANPWLEVSSSANPFLKLIARRKCGLKSDANLRESWIVAFETPISGGFAKIAAFEPLFFSSISNCKGIDGIAAFKTSIQSRSIGVEGITDIAASETPRLSSPFQLTRALTRLWHLQPLSIASSALTPAFEPLIYHIFTLILPETKIR